MTNGIKGMLKRQPWADLTDERKIKEYLNRLEKGDYSVVDWLLIWDRTPQGPFYWGDIYFGEEPLTKEDILFIKRSYGLLLEDLSDDEWD